MLYVIMHGVKRYFDKQDKYILTYTRVFHNTKFKRTIELYGRKNHEYRFSVSLLRTLSYYFLNVCFVVQTYIIVSNHFAYFLFKMSYNDVKLILYINFIFMY